MKQVSDPKLKLAISEVLLYKDRLLKANAKRNDRDDIPVEKYPLFAEIISLFTPTMEVGYVKKVLANPPTPEDIVWVKIGDSTIDRVEYKPISERHTDVVVEFSDDHAGMIEEFFKQRKDLATFVEYQLLKEWLYDTVEKETGSEGLVDNKNVVDESEGK